MIFVSFKNENFIMSKTIKKRLKELCFFVFFGGSIAYSIILLLSPNIIREEILQTKYYIPDGEAVSNVSI
jgi:hypothetical protein